MTPSAAHRSRSRTTRPQLPAPIVKLLVKGVREAIGVTLDLERGHVYYTSGASGRVGRANLDGGDAHDLVTGSGALTGIALAQLPSH